MAGALGVVGILCLGSACIYFWWRARHDVAYWKKVSARTAASGAVSAPFALAMTRHLWLLGAGLLLQGLSAPIGAYLDRLDGTSAEYFAKVLPLWMLLAGSAFIFLAFIVSLLGRSRYKDVTLD